MNLLTGRFVTVTSASIRFRNLRRLVASGVCRAVNPTYCIKASLDGDRKAPSSFKKKTRKNRRSRGCRSGGRGRVAARPPPRPKDPRVDEVSRPLVGGLKRSGAVKRPSARNGEGSNPSSRKTTAERRPTKAKEESSVRFPVKEYGLRKILRKAAKLNALYSAEMVAWNRGGRRGPFPDLGRAYDPRGRFSKAISAMKVNGWEMTFETFSPREVEREGFPGRCRVTMSRARASMLRRRAGMASYPGDSLEWKDGDRQEVIVWYDQPVSHHLV